MIKLIIFDLDGVLVDTKDIHYEALNLALKKVNKKYFIDYNSHINEFDGLSTLYRNTHKFTMSGRCHLCQCQHRLSETAGRSC